MAHCGATEHERQQPQPILIDITFRCPNQKAFLSDCLTDTVDYASVIEHIRKVGQGEPFSLLESLAEQISQRLFQEFPITHIKLWVRKTHPPIHNIKGSVGIHLNRTRSDFPIPAPTSPAPFLISQLPHLPTGHVLDVATGEGRHALYLANRGFSIHGVDRDPSALATLKKRALEASLMSITTEALDLERDPSSVPDLGTEQYDGIMVFFYLFRPLFPSLFQALKPGGFLLYETFHIDNHLQRHHPRRQEFCLQPNELLALLHNYRILHYEEGDHLSSDQRHHSFTVQVRAQKPSISESNTLLRRPIP